MNEIRYTVEPNMSDEALNALFVNAWENHETRQFGPVLRHSLTYICAFDGARLVGFVNVAWDGGMHGFILDTTVHRDYQRSGIGTELLRHAARVSAQRGIAWLHVDFAPYLEPFYRGAGYRRTAAGLLHLR
jgi:ribosomal protein S18 acetylase RimI-like enzyme